MPKTVLILSTLDTKSEETLYLRQKIESIGLGNLVMDLSMRGDSAWPADITPAQVAVAGGSSLEEIRSSRDRSKNTRITTAGASKIAGELFRQGRIAGVLAIGGSTGSLMATDVMRTLPFGVPKLMISSTAALPGLATRYIGTGDILLFHSVIEVAGVTDLLKNVVDRAVHAMAGMLSEGITPPFSRAGKAIAITMLSPCEQCASAVRDALEKDGYQVIGYSAAGVGDRAMEEMISQGLFHGVIDLAPGGVGEHLFGYMRDAGPDRMESAGRKGIAQVISTCSVNHMTPSKNKYKPDFYERRKYDLDKFRSWVRLSPEELKTVAGVFAQKLNGARGPVKVLIPSRGWSSVDIPGNPTYDPDEDRIFVKELRLLLDSKIELVEIEANMEEPVFAEAVVRVAREIF
ncbi:MAG: Tm-1-like ATP-binding domain-containing protein [Pseudomonadota bacterium]